jgi:hypothetical protein
VDETDDAMLRNDREKDGDVRSLRKMRALSVTMDTVTLTGKG